MFLIALRLNPVNGKASNIVKFHASKYAILGLNTIRGEFLDFKYVCSSSSVKGAELIEVDLLSYTGTALSFQSRDKDLDFAEILRTGQSDSEFYSNIPDC